MAGLFFLTTIWAQGVEVVVTHPSMDQRPGYPAIIQPGADLPELTVTSPSAGVLEAALVRVDPESVLQTAAPQSLVAGAPSTLNFTGPLPAEGVYRIDLRILENESIIYRNTYYFSQLDTAALPANYSRAAHPGPNGAMPWREPAPPCWWPPGPISGLC